MQYLFVWILNPNSSVDHRSAFPCFCNFKVKESVQSSKSEVTWLGEAKTVENSVIIIHGSSDKWVESMVVNLEIILIEWNPFASNHHLNTVRIFLNKKSAFF